MGNLRMTTMTCIEDLRKLAEKRVPRRFYQYADSGSWTEKTYRANESNLAGRGTMLSHDPLNGVTSRMTPCENDSR